MTSPALPPQLELSVVVTHLMKGVVYQDTHEKVWRQLLPLQAQIRDYVSVLGLTAVVDEAEGYAFLRGRRCGSARRPWPAVTTPSWDDQAGVRRVGMDETGAGHPSGADEHPLAVAEELVESVHQAAP